MAWSENGNHGVSRQELRDELEGVAQALGGAPGRYRQAPG